ncbi:unnamed protein product [Blepharisma stoltei]|uniref:EF-hand domain-containing protein n=1 Tax=Blepharisma stoltei TaxID=1481888 RepID=A0AAU9JEE6_9CILI|nr:unnamed protein product [Blepharisma stoltei]
MGCIRDKAKWELEESFVIDAQDKLGFSRFSSDQLVKTFHRYSPEFHLQQHQLEQAFAELGISLSEEKAQFYNKFKEIPVESQYYRLLQRKRTLQEDREVQYSTKKLVSMGIILSKSKPKEKLQSLFFDYDIDISSKLSEEEIETMISNVVEISFNYLPSLAAIYHPDFQIEIERYSRHLARHSSSFIGYLKYFIYGNRRSSISQAEFTNPSPQQEELIMFTDPSAMRKFVMKEFEVGEPPGEIKLKGEPKKLNSEKVVTWNKRKLRKKEKVKKRKQELQEILSEEENKP